MEINFRDDVEGYNVRPVKLQHITSFLHAGESKVEKIKIPRGMVEAIMAQPRGA